MRGRGRARSPFRSARAPDQKPADSRAVRVRSGLQREENSRWPARQRFRVVPEELAPRLLDARRLCGWLRPARADRDERGRECPNRVSGARTATLPWTPNERVPRDCVRADLPNGLHAGRSASLPPDHHSPCRCHLAGAHRSRSHASEECRRSAWRCDPEGAPPCRSKGTGAECDLHHSPP